MKKSVKTILMLVGLIIILLILYFVFFGKTATPPPSASTSQSGSSLATSNGSPINSIVNPKPVNEIEASQIGQEFINQLVNLQAIKLDDSIFSSLSFESLEDFTIVLIQPGNEGRDNPFAPFGIDTDTPTNEATGGVTDNGINVIPVNTLPGGGSATTVTPSNLPAPNNS